MSIEGCPHGPRALTDPPCKECEAEQAQERTFIPPEVFNELVGLVKAADEERMEAIAFTGTELVPGKTYVITVDNNVDMDETFVAALKAMFTENDVKGIIVEGASIRDASDIEAALREQIGELQKVVAGDLDPLHPMEAPVVVPRALLRDVATALYHSSTDRVQYDLLHAVERLAYPGEPVTGPKE